jgi:hypothetical protein
MPMPANDIFPLIAQFVINHIVISGLNHPDIG